MEERQIELFAPEQQHPPQQQQQEEQAVPERLDLEWWQEDEEGIIEPPLQLQPVEQAVPEQHRILDLEGWLQNNGLRGPEEAIPGAGVTTREEERLQFERYRTYAESVHQHAFRHEIANEEKREQQRQQVLSSLEGRTIRLESLVDGKTTNDLPLHVMAAACEAIFSKAHSWDHRSDNQTPLTMCLDFALEPIEQFANVILHEKEAAVIPTEHLIDCCFLAHFLCADRILNEIAAIFMNSIDNANCFAFCQIADKLELRALFERSLGHMMEKLGELEGSVSFGDLAPELRDRIAAIKKAIGSSIHTTSRFYFTTFDEYIAMFAERVQYFQERLMEAKEQLERFVAGTPAWRDASSKIERQEKRVRTLEIALSEQKKLFRNNLMRIR